MIKPLEYLKNADPVIGSIIREIGPYAIQSSPADFSTIVRCIIYQQLSGKVVAVLRERLKRALGEGVRMTPEAVLALSAEQMRETGLSRRKVEYIRGLAEGCRDGTIDLAPLERLPDADVLRYLTGIRGIGPWSAQMYMIFALGRLDILPVGDLGMRVAVRKAYGLDRVPTPEQVERLGQAWRPYATVATWYLWRSLGDGSGMDPE